jgi:hypothetical protein
MRVEERGHPTPEVHSDFLVKIGEANLPFDKFASALGELMPESNYVYGSMYGALPRGYNQIQGQARLTLVAPGQRALPELKTSITTALRKKFRRATSSD